MIQINDLSKCFGEQQIFKNLNFTVGRGDKIGLVGRNGSGKSTIFRMIMGDFVPDSGKIVQPRNYSVATLEQHIEFTKETVIEECSQYLSNDERYDEFKVEKILFGLGLSKEDMGKSPHTFSGGFQVRINLAKVLVQNPNLLLLDEPTNYLDIVSIRWLKTFLRTFPGEFVLITHDREFMDSVCNHTMGIRRKTLKKIKGPTFKYYEQIFLEDEIYEKTKANHDKRRKELENFVDRFKAKASKATQAQSRVKMLSKMEQMRGLENEHDLGFRFNYKACPGKILVTAKKINFGYDKKHKIVKDFDLMVNRNDRIAIIGKNGKGKSTLLNLLSGELKAQSGEVTYHPSLQMGHFGQTNINRLDDRNSIEQEITICNPDLGISKTRAICGTMMFEGDMALKKVSVLSGGERSRVLLGKILANPTNILLLDEPTNHLDHESIESLLIELERYKGAVIIVTHSEMILRQFAKKLIIFNRGHVELLDGGYNYFLDKIGWDDEDLPNGKNGKKRKLSRKEINKFKSDLLLEKSKVVGPLQKKLKKTESFVESLELKLCQTNQELIEASESGDAQRINTLSKDVANIENEIDQNFKKLEVITEKYESLSEDFRKRMDSLS